MGGERALEASRANDSTHIATCMQCTDKLEDIILHCEERGRIDPLFGKGGIEYIYKLTSVDLLPKPGTKMHMLVPLLEQGRRGYQLTINWDPSACS